MVIDETQLVMVERNQSLLAVARTRRSFRIAILLKFKPKTGINQQYEINS
jgi:hypothetical protein